MEQRQNGVTEEERQRFSCLWTAAEKRVAGVFSGERHLDVEGMTQWVCEKAYRKYAGGAGTGAGGSGEGYGVWVGGVVHDDCAPSAV